MKESRKEISKEANQGKILAKKVLKFIKDSNSKNKYSSTNP